jgi:hypothetical protein
MGFLFKIKGVGRIAEFQNRKYCPAKRAPLVKAPAREKYHCWNALF